MLESTLTDLYCPRTGTTYESDKIQTLSDVGGPLYARYDLEAAAANWRQGDGLAGRPPGLWRYADILPVRDPRFRLTLGEGGTPLFAAGRANRRREPSDPGGFSLRRSVGKHENAHPRRPSSA